MFSSRMAEIKVDLSSEIPLYKQLITSITQLIQSGTLQENDFLPSMNELSATLKISKETVKKAYNLLRSQGVIDSAHGKGFYVTKSSKGPIRVLVLFDKLSPYKQVLFQSFSDHLPNAEITIRLHNQDINLFEQFLDENLDLYDYYIVTAHFPLDREIQKTTKKAIQRIPFRKLILLDRNMEDLKGQYGVVFQDFENDCYDGLCIVADKLKQFKKLNVLSMKGSLYAPLIRKGVKKYCKDHKVDFKIYDHIEKKMVKKGQAFLILNSQLDTELIELVRLTKEKEFKIGKDVGILSYNESPINEIILDGLSVLSTDFKQMGKLAAGMITQKSFNKVKCDFGFVERESF